MPPSSHRRNSMKYNVYTKHGALVEANVDSERAAFLLDIQVQDLLWAIEEFGLASTHDAFAVKI
jgi:hypothetical protein